MGRIIFTVLMIFTFTSIALAQPSDLSQKELLDVLLNHFDQYRSLIYKGEFLKGGEELSEAYTILKNLKNMKSPLRVEGYPRYSDKDLIEGLMKPLEGYRKHICEGDFTLASLELALFHSLLKELIKREAELKRKP
ncbi:MAG: hypothetical protein ABIH63_04185 [archaeon]